MTLGDFSLEMTFIQRDGVCQPQVPLSWVRHPLSLCENNSFFPYPAMDISLSLFCLWKCLFSKQSPEAALGNCPHTEMEWGVSYLLWVPVSPLCMGMQEGLGTAGPQDPQEGAPSAAGLRRWKSPALSVSAQYLQKSRQCYSLLPPFEGSHLICFSDHCCSLNSCLQWSVHDDTASATLICLQVGSNRWHKAGKRIICH